MTTRILALLAVSLLATPAAASDWTQDFESDTSGWDVFGGALDATRVPSGSHGIPSAGGAFHAEVAAGATHWGGYGALPGCASGGCAAGSFPAHGYRTSVAVWLDVDGPFANGTRFDFSSAVCDPSGAQRRDFVFNAGFFDDTDGSPGSGSRRFVISAGNDSQPVSAHPKDPGHAPIAVLESGWYTFTHDFHDGGGGVLACDLTIHDAGGGLVASWTLSDPSDVIDVTVGGNRYGWFDFDEFPYLAIDDSALALTPAPCLTVAEAEPCALPDATLAAPDLDDLHGLVVVHWNAGVTPGSTTPADVAFVEIVDAQLEQSASLPDPQDHALNAVLPAGTSDGSNLPPTLLTLDAAAVDFGEPAFGGQPAAWTLDRYDGSNAPGDLAGARAHTLLFGGVTDGICERVETEPAPGELLARTVFAVEAGLLHAYDGPEVDLTTALAWDGSAFSTPVPDRAPVLPFLLLHSPLQLLGDSSDVALLSGSADPGFVTLYGVAPCRRETLSSVVENRLALVLDDPGTCYAPGDLMLVRLEMGCLEGQVSGFFASVDYDPTRLAFQPSLGGTPPSSYTSTPFPLHIDDPIDDGGSGTILLDGSLDFLDPPTVSDALLATLVFVVLPGGDGLTTNVGFTPSSPFPSELSYAGLPLDTRLGGPLGVSLDETPPVIRCDGDVSVLTDPGLCSALVEVPPPAAADGCGVLAVSGVRSDLAPLDAPYPAGCAPGEETTITWTAVDCAGLQASCVQTVRVVDAEAPVISGLPSGIVTIAAASDCSAVVSWPDPSASDACDPMPSLVCVPPSGSTFAAGVTTVTCTATDACGNARVETFDVAVVEVDTLDVTIDLVGVTLPTTRCIRFMGDDCSIIAELPLPFVDHDGDDADSDGYVDGTVGTTYDQATPVRFSGLVPVGCGLLSSICAKDTQHTTWDSTTVTPMGTTWKATDVLELLGGDDDFDGDVDAADVSFFLFKFGGHQRVGTCPYTGFPRDADFSNNDGVGTEDYAFLVANYGVTSSCACTPSATSGPTLSVDALLTAGLDPVMQDQVDLDGDGWFDAHDVELFERRHGLGDALSRRMGAREGR